MQGPSETVTLLLELHDIEDKINAAKRRVLTGSAATHHAKLRSLIPEVILSHHDRMRIKGKRSVAPIRNWVCCGCFISIPIGERSHVTSGKDLYLCQICGRFLYLETEEAPLPNPVAQPVLAQRVPLVKRARTAKPAQPTKSARITKTARAAKAVRTKTPARRTLAPRA